jgi:PLP dependent protein
LRLMYEHLLRDNLPRGEERVARATAWTSRSDVVRLVAVTKGHPLAAVTAVRHAGLRDVGENRVQELDEKHGATAAADGALNWHLIGHLQRNKVRRAVQLCDWIQSVDSLRLAQELSREATRAAVTLRVLLQVNVSGEATKGGFAGEQAMDGIAEVAALPGLACAGLMTIAPFTDDEAVLRSTFAATREIRDRCVAAGVPLGRELSMGMSGDYEIAIEEGSTMIRLGTVLFGERQ